MAKAIEQLPNGLTIGHFALGRRGAGFGSVPQEVHDGDTINARADLNFGVRFLGVDAPEISFQLPGSRAFTSIANPAWETFLTNPFAATYPPIALPTGLKNNLKQRLGVGAGTNHAAHAAAARTALMGMVTADMTELGQDGTTFKFFLAFATEALDRYGRLLAYINRDQLDGVRPNSYNERMLEAGFISPYFIWPNINPFRKQKDLISAVLEPRTAKQVAQSEAALRKARGWVQAARAAGTGLFAAPDPLRVQPFEVRFLAQRRVPNRWVIDLSKNSDLLVRPDRYYTIRNDEDRLYIPPEYADLFIARGWRKEA